ncbi:hypothetical protein [Microbulbifer rhizosphaerae]|uniref:Uncharacterized protein n=1 Tax=Microbulbifer rhizosphaerae TaxID=1562603 RepID=A0A7W4Z933_9GAMM|nr:hypothetical protein [Microbulbifer rhizosphaerae]MBB3061408.1 hypothetical protein [Microbulbifer rhizosphaerae]
MSQPMNQQSLTDLFRQLGAPDPESWAKSQAEMGVNQLYRFLFLRQAWERVISEDDDSRIDANIDAAKQDPNAPYAGVGHAVDRILAAGVSREDIVDLVRGMQAELLFDFCYLLDDPAIMEPNLESIGWTLVETTKDFEPTPITISALHGSVLETDPTGREMSPRK